MTKKATKKVKKVTVAKKAAPVAKTKKVKAAKVVAPVAPVATSNLMSIADLAAKYSVDGSYLSDLIRANHIATVDAISKNGKACKAVSEAEIAKLIALKPRLSAIELDATKHITIAEMATATGLDPWGLRKTLIKKGFKFQSCRPKDGGKALQCLTREDFAKYLAANPKRIRLA